MGYSDAITSNGGLALAIPTPRPNKISTYSYSKVQSLSEFFNTYASGLDILDALILTGGGDLTVLSPSFEPIDSTWSLDAFRDIWEMTLFSTFMKWGKPILGICRGMQLINVAMGGTLWEDISSCCPGSLNHSQSKGRSSASHKVTLEDKSFLSLIYGQKTIEVNSGHHQAIKDLAPMLKATGFAPDGVIEALEHQGGKRILGVQWHPEGMFSSDALAQKLFKAFLELCR
jgi:putative glutamine amidotransferase